MSKSTNIKLSSGNNFNESFEVFQAANKAKNLSKASIENYDISAKLFLKFMDCEDLKLSRINQDTIIKYIEYCKQRGNNDISINSRLRNLRVILNFFAEHDYMDKVKIKMLKVDKPIKETYSESELKILLKKPNVKTSAFDDIRTWAIINFFIGTACRLSTLINIRMSDISLQEGYVIFRHTKSRAQQMLPLSSALIGVLAEYLKYRKPQKDDDFLFPTWHNEQLTPSGLKNSVRRYNQRRGVMRSSIHAFRHSFARLWIINNGNVFKLQKILGHKSLEMTKQYVELFSVNLVDDMETFSPLQKLNQHKEYIKL